MSLYSFFFAELNENLRAYKAEQEKCKGNEAFNAGCFEEAIVYYNRSIEYQNNPASYNNRALACTFYLKYLLLNSIACFLILTHLEDLKLEKWDKVVEDCHQVLAHEKNNIKAYLRRATAYLKLKKYTEAEMDVKKCFKLEPNSKKALVIRLF